MGCPIYLLEAHSRQQSAKEKREEEERRVYQFCIATKTVYCNTDARLCLAELNLVLDHAADGKSWMPLLCWLPWYVMSSVHVRCAVKLKEQEKDQEGTSAARACTGRDSSFARERNAGGRKPTAVCCARAQCLLGNAYVLSRHLVLRGGLWVEGEGGGRGCDDSVVSEVAGAWIAG
jgi:hypothetical protein